MHADRITRLILCSLPVFLASPVFADLRLLQNPVNLGKLQGATVYSGRVEYVNDGNVPVEIVEVRRACGCLAPVLTQTKLAPGAKGSFLMQVRTLGQPNGPRSWQATLCYRQGDAIRETALTITGDVQNDVTLEPTVLALSVSGVLKQEVRLVDRRRPALNVTAARVNAAGVRVKTEPGAAGLTRILLEVHGEELVGERQDALLDIYTDDPIQRHFQVPITLLRASASLIRPVPEAARVSLGASNKGVSVVRLRSTSDRPLVVDRVEADHAALRCTCVAGPGNDATLRIEIDGKGVVGPLPDVIVHFREPAGQTVRVPIELRRD